MKRTRQVVTPSGDPDPLPSLDSDLTPERRPRSEFAWLVICGSVSLFLGQSLQRTLPIGSRSPVAFVVVGLGLFFLGAHGFLRGRLPVLVERLFDAVASWLRITTSQLILLGLAPWLSLAAGIAAGDGARMRSPVLATISWLVAIVFLIIGSREHHPDTRIEARRWSKADLLTVVALTTAAFLLRGTWTAQIPWLLTGDEASAGLTAVQFTNGTRDNVFSIGWFSFPSMYFFIQSLSIRLAGQTIEALRLTSAAVGALTVVAVYGFASRTFGRTVAIASAAYMAGFHFHIHFSRIGLMIVWDALFVALFSWALFRAWGTNERRTFLVAGAILGLAQYFYTSSRALFLMVPLWLALAAWKERATFRTRLPNIFLLGLATLVVVLPLVTFFAAHPDEFTAAMQRVTIFGNWMAQETQNTGRSAVLVVLEQLKRASLGFTSMDLRLAYQPGHPMLLPLAATLFTLGLLLLCFNVFDLAGFWLTVWLLAAVLTVGLSQSPPAAQRYTFAAPAVAVLVALPIGRVAEWLGRVWPTRRRIVYAALAGLMLVAISMDLSFYFGDYTASHRFGDPNTEVAHTLGQYLAARDEALQVYFFGPPRMGLNSISTIPYLAPKAVGQDVIEPLQSPPEWELDRPAIFVFLPERKDELTLVRESYPGGEVIEQMSESDSLLFVAYLVH